MHRLLSLAAMIATAILAVVGVANAGAPQAPVPEPSSITLLGVGAAALAWWRMSRRK
jgi:PEP-CTERM motif